jgi:predicted amidophosphoribosyltransferase
VSIAIFVLLALGVAVAVIYPLLPGRAPRPSAQRVTDSDIEQAVRRFYGSRRSPEADLFCPSCDQGYQPGDRFCVGCGEELPQAASPSDGTVCSSCGNAFRESDRFCAKCGQARPAEEAL